MALKPSFHKFTTSGGAQIFRLPLEAFPRFWAYAYLVLVEDRIVLIDTGAGNEASNADLVNGLKQVSRMISRTVGLDDLSDILITHGHIDHFGGLIYLQGKTRARVGIHELDLQTVSGHEERLALMSRRLGEFLGEAGVPAEERGAMITMYKFTKAFYHSVPVDYTYEAAGMKAGPFEMVHLPGHCPGHVAIRLEDVIFSGDHVLDRIIPHQAPESIIQYMGIGHYLESLARLEGWAAGARLVLNGHDSPIENLPARVEAIRQALAGRLEQTLGSLNEPVTIAEITARLYPDVGGYNALLVLEKVGAYVEYLYQRGLLCIANMDELETQTAFAGVRYQRRDHPTAALNLQPMTFAVQPSNLQT